MKKFISTLIVVSILSGCFGTPSDDGWPQFNGTEWAGKPAPDFILINQDGENVSLSDFENKIVVIAFTFSTCPDICPMIEYNMNLAKEALGDSYGNEVVFISISIDPLIDTPEKMKEYWHDGLGYDWDHLTHTDNGTIEKVWESYAIIVDKAYLQAHVVDQIPINASDNMYDDLWIVLEHWNMFGENGQRHVKTPSAINHIENILSQHTTINIQQSHHLNSNNYSLIINNGSDTKFLTIDSNELDENTTGWGLALESLNSENISYNITNNNDGIEHLEEINGEFIEDWQLMIWNDTSKAWENSQLDFNSNNLNELYNSGINNIAIIKNEIDNITNLPIEIRNDDLCGFEYVHENNHYSEIINEIYLWCEYNNNDTVFLEKVSTHITNYIESLNENNSEEESSEYTLGHSTVTLILDKEHNRRVAWTGYNWDHLLFIEDIQLLMNE
ncbi:MAG: SCO family protein [Candidatus Thermoplasmatota archaeon]|nr:SCO family protein [Candidatus Thermoplasmatota archaeon]